MAVRHWEPSAVGFTQASSVIALVRSSEVESATFTMLLTPLKLSAEPNLPLVVQVAPEIVPLFPLPDRSGSEVPDPWSKLYAATSPAGAACVTTALAWFEGPDRLPGASSAATL